MSAYPTVRATATAVTTTPNAPLGLTIPAGAVIGDLLIVGAVVIDPTATSQPASMTSDWTFGTWNGLTADWYGSTADDTYVMWWWKIATASDPGTTVYISPEPSQGSNEIMGVVLDYEGASPVGPSAAWGTTASIATSLASDGTNVAVAAGGVALQLWSLAGGSLTGNTFPATSEVSANDGVQNVLAATDQQYAAAAIASAETATSTAPTNWRSATIAIPPVLAPYAPPLTAPLNASYADLAGTPTFTASYTAQPGGGTVTGYAFRRKVAGATSYQYWNASAGSWQSTIVWNTATSLDVTFPSGAWADATTWNWSMAVQASTNSLQGQFSPDATVNAQAAPTATITDPTGTIVTVTPTVAWTTTLPAGASPTAFEVWIYTAAQVAAAGFVAGTTPPTWGSGIVSTYANSIDVPAGVLSNLASYTVYVQITETGGETGPLASSSFTVNAQVPNTPTLTATPGTDPTTGAPLVDLLVQGNDTGTFVGITAASITYSDDLGQTWWPLRNGTAVPLPASNQQVTIVDHECPAGFTRQYRCQLTAVV